MLVSVVLGNFLYYYRVHSEALPPPPIRTPMHKQSLLEKTFESILWKSRLSTIFVVIFSAIGALGLFIMGSLEIYHAIAVLWDLEHHTKDVYKRQRSHNMEDRARPVTLTIPKNDCTSIRD